MSSTEEKPAPIIFGDESISDVTIVVGNQDFKIHKMVLASRSDVFKAMFYGDFKESKEERVEIKDVSVNTFRRLLEIIYTGKVSDPLEFLEFPIRSFNHFLVFIGYTITGIDTVNPYQYTPSYKMFFHNFWNDTTELTNIADRFNLTPMVKDYLGSTTINATNICRNDECHQCLNSFIFALFNETDVSKCEKKYSKSLHSTWTEYAGKKPFPEAIPVNVMKTIYQYQS